MASQHMEARRRADYFKRRASMEETTAAAQAEDDARGSTADQGAHEGPASPADGGATATASACGSRPSASASATPSSRPDSALYRVPQHGDIGFHMANTVTLRKGPAQKQEKQVYEYPVLVTDLYRKQAEVGRNWGIGDVNKLHVGKRG